MRRTIRVRLCDRKQAWGHFATAAFFAVAFTGAIISVSPLSSLVFIPFLLFVSLPMLAAGLAHKKQDGLEVVCSPEGLEAVIGDKVLWRLPWDRYGGYRQTKQHFLRDGTEILDLDGNVCGTLPLNLPYASKIKPHVRLMIELRREIDRRVPENGIRPGPPEPSWLGKQAEKHPYLTMISGGVVVVIFFALVMEVTKAYRAEELPKGWVEWFAQGYRVGWLAVPLCAGLLVAIYGMIGLSMRSERRKMDRRKEILPPYEGPTLREHRFDQLLEKQIAFKEGVLYKYVQPEAMKELLRAEMGSTQFVGIVGSLMLLVMGVLGWNSPGFPRWMAAAFVVGGIWAFFWMRARRLRCEEVSRSLDDMMVWEEGVMTVVRSEGPRLSFPMPQMRPVKPMLDSVRIRVLKHGDQRYAFDPTHMFPADEAV